MFKTKGFTLIEVLIFITLISFIFIALSYLSVITLLNSKIGEHKTLAAHYSEELREWLRGQKEVDWYVFFNKSSAGGTGYCFAVTPISNWTAACGDLECGGCGYSMGVLPNTTFKRYVKLTQNTNPDWVKTEIIVEWKEGSNTFEVASNTIFSSTAETIASLPDITIIPTIAPTSIPTSTPVPTPIPTPIPMSEHPLKDWGIIDQKNYDWNFTLGYKFRVDSPGIITKIGRYSNGPKRVTLWDEAGNIKADVSNVGEGTTSYDWVYANITSVPVLENEHYTIAVYFAGSEGTANYYPSLLPHQQNKIHIEKAMWNWEGGYSRPTTEYYDGVWGADIEFVPN